MKTPPADAPATLAPKEDPRAEMARINGLKGGRPPGRRNTKTLILEAARKDFNLAVAEKARELLAMQLKIAAMGSDSPSAANSAIDSLLDRAFGRATPRQDEDIATQAPVTIVNVYAPNTAPAEPAPKPIAGRLITD